MSTAIHWLAHELREAAVPAAFFFVAFVLAILTRTLLLESYGLTATRLSVAVVGALIVAKAALIADKLPFVDRFGGRPLVFAILWRSAIYWVLCMAFRFVEELVPLWSRYGSPGTAVEHLVEEAAWPLFFATQLWLVLALILYNTLAELDRHFGAGSIRRALLSGSARPSA
jgi:hypothetical protein